MGPESSQELQERSPLPGRLTVARSSTLPDQSKGLTYGEYQSAAGSLSESFNPKKRLFPQFRRPADGRHLPSYEATSIRGKPSFQMVRTQGR